jgi:hypothetical protein
MDCCDHDPERGNPSYRRALWIGLAINAGMLSFRASACSMMLPSAVRHASSTEFWNTMPAATSDEVEDLRREADALKEVVAERSTLRPPATLLAM